MSKQKEYPPVHPNVANRKGIKEEFKIILENENWDHVKLIL